VSSSFHRRGQNNADKQFADMLAGWLDSLPPEGWHGGYADLEREWFTFATSTGRLRQVTPRSGIGPRWLGPDIPVGPGTGRALGRFQETIRSAGWRVEFRRTSSVRTVAFVKVPAVSVSRHQPDPFAGTDAPDRQKDPEATS
jgi:hypothetical protein